VSFTIGASYPALVGKVLADFREKNGLDQAAMAEKVGISRSTWSRIENGDSGLSMDQLAKAAEALGTEPSKILAEADRAGRALKEGGVTITPTRADAPGSGTTFLFGAALGALIVTALSKK